MNMDKLLSKTLEVRHIIEPAREAVLYIDGRRKGLIKSLRSSKKKAVPKNSFIFMISDLYFISQQQIFWQLQSN
jgi:hypothetical protein